MTTKRYWTHSLFALALLAVFVSAGTILNAKGKPPKDEPPPPDISFSLTLLGTLGGLTSEAWAMNEAGDVVGMSQTAETVLNGDGDEVYVTAPFVYFSDTNQMVDLRDLLTQADRDLWRWEYFAPRGINSGLDNGPKQICGGALKLNDVGDLQSYAIRITLPQQVDEKALVEIVSPDISISAGAEGINEFGDVTGRYQLEGGISRAFVYTESNGIIEDIGDLGGDRASGFAVNNLGEITGYSENADGESHAFLFIPGDGMQDLGIIKKAARVFISGNNSFGHDLNDGAVVVGISVAGSKNGSLNRHAFREAGNGMDDLKTLDGDSNSGATSINSDGKIVGWSVGRDYRWRGFLFTDEFGMMELDALIVDLPSNTAGIIRNRNLQINNAGKICGSITYTVGTAEAFVLTPNP